MRELEKKSHSQRVRQVIRWGQQCVILTGWGFLEGSDWSRTASQMSQVHILWGFTAALLKFPNTSMKDFPATSHTSCGDVIFRFEQFLYGCRDGAGWEQQPTCFLSAWGIHKHTHTHTSRLPHIHNYQHSLRGVGRREWAGGKEWDGARGWRSSNKSLWAAWRGGGFSLITA